MKESPVNTRPHLASGAAEPSEQEIAHCAYFRWRENGCPPGTELMDWFAAKEWLQHRHGRPPSASRVHRLRPAAAPIPPP